MLLYPISNLFVRQMLPRSDWMEQQFLQRWLRMLPLHFSEILFYSKPYYFLRKLIFRLYVKNPLNTPSI
jgi:hypothetical protein